MSELVSLHRFGIGTLCRLLGERLFGHHGVICLIFAFDFGGGFAKIFVCVCVSKVSFAHVCFLFHLL